MQPYSETKLLYWKSLLLELKWSDSEQCVWIAVLQMFLQQPIQGEFAGSGSQSPGPGRPAQHNTHPKPQHCASHSSHTLLREQPSSSSAQVRFTQHTHITHSQTCDTHWWLSCVYVCLGAAETGSDWTHAGRQCSNADTHQSHHTLLQQPNDVLPKPRTQNPTRHTLPKKHAHRLQPGWTATVTTHLNTEKQFTVAEVHCKGLFVSRRLFSLKI